MPSPGLLSRLKNRSRSGSRARRRRDVLFRGLGHDWRLEERCLMAGIAFPGPFVGSMSDVFYDGATGQYAKTITITNNSPDTIYPFLEGENSRAAVGPYSETAAFDPYDPVNQEYRGYIGYTDGGVSYLGLPSQATITVTVPLVFWDSGRFIVSTDGADQFATYGGDASHNPPGAPFNFFDNDSFARYPGSIQTINGQKVLEFTPIYNGFDSTPAHMPTTANWKSPIASGNLPVLSPRTNNKQTYLVTGAGLPGGSELVTLDASQPTYIVLPQGGTVGATDQYTFQAVTSDPTHTPQAIFTTARYVETKVPLTVTTNGVSTPTTNGAVMWYHDLNPSAPNNVAPFQLTEFSFRGPFYDKTVNIGTGFDWLLDGNNQDSPTGVYAGSIHDLADYDLSFVDHMDLPLAMEATGVTIPGTADQAPFGWVGSSQSVQDFQTAIQDFASTNTPGTNGNFLGNYFDGKGYPSFNVIQDGNVKLPSAQNLFLASPLVPGGASVVQFFEKFSDNTFILAPMYALTSGVAGPTQLGIGGSDAHVPLGGKSIGLATDNNLANQAALTDFIGKNLTGPNAQEWVVKDNNNGLNLGLVDSIIYQMINGIKTPVGVNLKNALPSGVKSTDSFVFTPVVTDYAATRIASLWYSWAQYYAQRVQSTPTAKPLAGTISNGNILTLTNPPSGLTLVPGMAVSGADGTNVPPGCIILSVSPDNKTIELSGVVNLVGSGKFGFAAPNFKSIPGYNQLPHVDLDFSKATPEEQARALQFAQTVFTVLSGWSVSVQSQSGNPLVWNPLMVNIIGGNLSNEYIPAGNEDVRNALTILSKSALRGVPNYTSPLYSDPSQWYPDPALATGGQKYNVFNLDPFVWFTHAKLGLTAYAFSLDDDIGNVEAGGSTNIDVNIGGLAGLPAPSGPARMTLPEKDPYSNTAQFGVVNTNATASGVKSSVLGDLSDPTTVGKVIVYNNPHHTVGTLVNGPGIAPGTTIQFTQISQAAPATNKIVITAPVTSADANSPYSFFGQLVFTATVLAPGQSTKTLILTDKFTAGATLAKLGPLGNIRVTGEGIDPAQPPVTITGMSTDKNSGVTTITLSQPLVAALVKTPGTSYGYTFGAAKLDVVRDGGFEYYVVGKVTGNYLHGAEISPPQNAPITDDWTFFDSPTNPKNWFAGIAIAPNSQYAGKQQVAPQGLQVGFVQGNSYITQPVILAQGNYTISLMAAQSATNPAGESQSLNVIVDGNTVKTIKPTGTTFTQFSNIEFTVGPGTHTIELQGVEKNGSTVLIDSFACKAVAAALTSTPRRCREVGHRPRPECRIARYGKRCRRAVEFVRRDGRLRRRHRNATTAAKPGRHVCPRPFLHAARCVHGDCGCDRFSWRHRNREAHADGDGRFAAGLGIRHRPRRVREHALH